jgi:hypothetical protein
MKASQITGTPIDRRRSRAPGEHQLGGVSYVIKAHHVAKFVLDQSAHSIWSSGLRYTTTKIF